MIEQNVQVVRCRDQRIWVRVGAQAGCSVCADGKGCGAGVFSSLLQHKPAIIELARQDIDVRPGQMVTLAFPEQVYLQVVLAYYGWPLLAALLGALAGYALANWFQFEALLLDVSTLVGGILAGGMLLQVLNRTRSSGSALDSLQMAVHQTSPTPDMCAGSLPESERD